MEQSWINALIGGSVIGLAVSLMLVLNGRVTGISGILSGALSPTKGDTQWRWFFIAGLLFGGIILKTLNSDVFSGQIDSSMWTVVVAGVLVGFGTLLGSGCTSGHGICGMSRFSLRSVVATISFMAAGILAVYFFRTMGVLPLEMLP